MTRFINIFVILFGILTILTCDRPSGQSESSDSSYANEKTEFEKKIDKRLSEIDAELAKLKTSGQEVQEEMRQEWDLAMETLDDNKEKTKNKLTEIRQSTKENWQQVKQEASKVLDDLEEAYKRAVSFYKDRNEDGNES